MKILKFGGTSVGSAERIKSVASLINNGEKKVVVLSAMSGTTNSLVEISDSLYKKDKSGALELIQRLEEKYNAVVDELLKDTVQNAAGHTLVLDRFNTLRKIAGNNFDILGEKEVLAQGELISTHLMYYLLQEQGISSALIPALDYMRIDENGEPVMGLIREGIASQLEKFPNAEIYITQGFICRNPKGEIDNLKRGGSDYSASLIGAALKAEEIQIWTDIDGMHNNDPRIVENTKPIAQLSFDEAAELAYFGAKILHPTSVLPARLENVPVRLLNTLEPDAEGTRISSVTEQNKIKAVAAKDNITAIKIKSGRMLLAYGFMRRVFEVFEKYKTSIDMVTTSEVGVSITIDNNTYLQEIVNDLKELGTVTVDENLVIVCVAGDFSIENTGFVSQITDALKNIKVRMVSYGGSLYNISVLINAEDKKIALQSLSKRLFNA